MSTSRLLILILHAISLVIWVVSSHQIFFIKEVRWGWLVVTMFLFLCVWILALKPPTRHQAFYLVGFAWLWFVVVASFIGMRGIWQLHTELIWLDPSQTVYRLHPFLTFTWCVHISCAAGILFSTTRLKTLLWQLAFLPVTLLFLYLLFSLEKPVYLG